MTETLWLAGLLFANLWSAAGGLDAQDWYQNWPIDPEIYLPPPNADAARSNVGKDAAGGAIPGGLLSTGIPAHLADRKQPTLQQIYGPGTLNAQIDAIRVVTLNPALVTSSETPRPTDTPILPALKPGEKSTCELPPSNEEILRALPTLARGIPYVYDQYRDEVEITTEKLVDKVDGPRFFPLIGQAQLHHCHWKCTVHYTEVIEIAHPFPFTTKTKHREVVYIDTDHLHLYTNEKAADAETPEPPQNYCPGGHYRPTPKAATKVEEAKQVQLEITIVSIDRGAIPEETYQRVRMELGLCGDGNSSGVAKNQDAAIKLLKSLRSDGFAKVLAEPRAITISGKMARILSGGEVEISVLPVAEDDGRINLELSVLTTDPYGESLGRNQSLTIDPLTRTSSASASIGVGEALAFGGLTKKEVTLTKSGGIPLLDELPCIGEYIARLTQTIARQETERELLILVTPRVVAPGDASETAEPPLHSEPVPFPTAPNAEKDGLMGAAMEAGAGALLARGNPAGKVYVIVDAGDDGQQVTVLKAEEQTVLDVVGSIKSLQAGRIRKVRVSRVSSESKDGTVVLPVDWRAITELGLTASNYQLEAGDRVYVYVESAKEAEAAAKAQAALPQVQVEVIVVSIDRAAMPDAVYRCVRERLGLSGDAIGYSVAENRDAANQVMQALQNDGRLKVLSKPQIMAASGQAANITIASRVTTKAPAVSCRHDELSFKVMPVVKSDGKIYLEIEYRDASRGSQVGAELDAGRTLHVGGLTHTEVTVTEARFSLLAELFGIGSSTEAKEEETERELLLIVTPRICEDAQTGGGLPAISPADGGDVTEKLRSVIIDGILRSSFGEVFGGPNFREVPLRVVDLELPSAFQEIPSVPAVVERKVLVIVDDGTDNQQVTAVRFEGQSVLDMIADIDSVTADNVKKICVMRPTADGNDGTILPIDWRQLIGAGRCGIELAPGDCLRIWLEPAKASREAMTLDDIVKMAQAGASAKVIIRQMELTDAVFSVTVDDIVYLREQKVSNRIISAMQERRAKSAARIVPPAQSKYSTDYPQQAFERGEESEKNDKAGNRVVTEVMAHWYERVQFVTDKANGEKKLPGLVGKVYLANQNGDRSSMAEADGCLNIEMYDLTPGTQPAMLAEFHFDAETLKGLKQTDKIGLGYTLFLPWENYRPEITQVELRVVYMPENVGQPQHAEPQVIRLRTAEAAPILEQADNQK